MIRSTLIALAVAATAATALAAVHPSVNQVEASKSNVTIIHKNDVFPIIGPIEVQECAVEDCSDVQS